MHTMRENITGSYKTSETKALSGPTNKTASLHFRRRVVTVPRTALSSASVTSTTSIEYNIQARRVRGVSDKTKQSFLSILVRRCERA